MLNEDPHAYYCSNPSLFAEMWHTCRMTFPTLKINGLTMPEEFPAGAFENIHTELVKFAETNPDLYSQFGGAWNALSYRYLSLVEAGIAFTKSIDTYGSAPNAPRRYEQERLLFEFFSNGFSVYEAYFYGMYAIGALIDSTKFPLATPAHQQAVNPTRTMDAYLKAFPEHPILSAFTALTGDSAYRECREIRNVLTHRSAPGRTIFVSFGGSESPVDQWKISNIPLDNTMSGTRRAQATKLITAALNASSEFVQEKLS
jgi:hypothetical protein